MEFGKTLKTIRLAKGLRQKELNNALMSRTSISKIENGNQTPSYAKAIALISELGLSPNEFEYIRNNFHLTPKQEIIQSFINLSYPAKNVDLVRLGHQCNQLLAKGADPDVTSILLVTKALLAFRTSPLTQSQKTITPVWQYLQKHESWTLLDLYLVNQLLFLLAPETALMLVKVALKIITTKYPQRLLLKNELLLNEARLFMQQSQWDAAISLLTTSMLLSKRIQRFDLLLLAKARVALCQGNTIQAEGKRQLLLAMGASALAEWVAHESTVVRRQQNLTHI
ncbi:helix-turn-helix domain-containing protein [Pediococcus siamensis]|uniref:helix-turn-helix domain-containing protein n=1 Tax=Pediococcus siamensis TaxID=381829 RepID=UPI00399F7755